MFFVGKHMSLPIVSSISQISDRHPCNDVTTFILTGRERQIGVPLGARSLKRLVPGILIHTRVDTDTTGKARRNYWRDFAHSLPVPTSKLQVARKKLKLPAHGQLKWSLTPRPL